MQFVKEYFTEKSAFKLTQLKTLKQDGTFIKVRITLRIWARRGIRNGMG